MSTKKKPKRKPRSPKPRPIEYGDVLKFEGSPVYVLGLDEEKVWVHKPFQWGFRVLTLEIPQAYNTRVPNARYQPEKQDVH